ncbi:glycosyltransferase family 4 protein [Roseibium sp. RKSG952]|uniref:glycosyltransferase family 4 protein n=1 Tax=Roseibium sp. RKSG952 TaxID=2529384 RepID=UPI0012BD6325|nr:glycosyltransferase family 4 protein [Roseibium sp. RKSG952]MTH97013.1 glycosyltransferase [Roseibium sp. RKSG952]
MNLAIVLPRGMHFSPNGATSIDLVAHDLLVKSRYRDTACVIGREVPDPFHDVPFEPVSAKDFVKGAVQVLKVRKPDLIVVHQHPESAAKIARALPATPVVLHRHGLMRHKRGLLSRWRKGRALKPLAAAIFVSDFIRSDFLDAHPATGLSTLVVPNGVDGSYWAPAKDKRQVIAFAGRARADKGLEPLLDAFLAIKPPGWQLNLMLVVQTPEEQAFFSRLAARVPDDAAVQIDKNLAFPEVRQRFAETRIAALPSIVAEGFPRAVVEAMACGCAVVTTTRGGTPEAAGDAAILVDASSTSKMEIGIAMALTNLTSDANMLENYARAARNRFEQHLEIGAVSNMYDHALTQILTAQTTVAIEKGIPS